MAARTLSVLRWLGDRWISIVGALLLLAVGALLVDHASGVYYGRTQLVMIAPTENVDSNGLSLGPESLIDFAGLIERTYEKRPADSRFASDDATIAGSGVKEGTEIRLASNGGQWATNFNTPVLIVESVSADQRTAVDRLTRTIAALRSIAAETQATAGVPSANRITVLASPTAPQVQHMAGSRVRGLAAVAVIAAGFAILSRTIVVRRRRLLAARG